MSRAVTLVGYAVIAVAALSVEVSARRRDRGARFSQLVSAALDHRALRLALLAAWLWVGWHVFVRVDWR